MKSFFLTLTALLMASVLAQERVRGGGIVHEEIRGVRGLMKGGKGKMTGGKGMMMCPMGTMKQKGTNLCLATIVTAAPTSAPTSSPTSAPTPLGTTDAPV
jgi:hypothetical protein